MSETYQVTQADIDEIADSLDETGGMLIKDSELKHWIAEHIRRDRLTRDIPTGTDKSLEIINSRADNVGNRYYAFRFQDLITGKTVEATIRGGESNIKAVTFNWSGNGDWDRSIKIDIHEIGIRQFDRKVKDWPYAGCNPDDIRAFIKKGLALD